MITFDERGYLKPYVLTKITLDELYDFFVLNFPDSTVRSTIFDQYLAYINDLKQLVSDDCIQWLGGSFISKKVNPADIDVVTILNSSVYERHEQLIVDNLSILSPNFPYRFVDAYFVRDYPQGSKKWFISEADRAYWLNLFGTSRPHRNGQKYRKGIVEIQLTTL